MKLSGRWILGAAVAASLALPVAARADVNTNTTPDYKEVFDLIKAHLAGETESDLNRDAVQGLVNQLHPKVLLVTGKSESPVISSNARALTNPVLYDGQVAYLGVARVEAGLAAQISTALKQLDGTNHLAGVVVDLRFAGGQDYAEAAAVADLFIDKEKPLLDWGSGFVRSKANPDAWTLPLAILVNQKTAAAAETLAAVLREDDRAIILGASTAGEASMSEDFPLRNGQSLRIATAAIKLGGGETISTSGVKPDIEVTVSPENERTYYANPYAEIVSPHGVIPSIVGAPSAEGTNGTNRVHQRPLNEAELMRERKEKPGVDVEDLVPLSAPGDAEPEKPVIRDPVLGRALDLIKGIAVVRKTQAP
jgi:Peptidase family S41